MPKRQKSKRPVTAACLFAGMGGFATGLREAGIATLWANEMDGAACKTFIHNHPGTNMIEEDIRHLSVKKNSLPPVDILTAGFPCQSFSIAGHKRGFDDERGRLFQEIIRIIKEFGDAKPKILLMENVPHLQNGNGGQWLETIVSEVQFAGYWFDSKSSVSVLNTAHISPLPQHRERLFMAALCTDTFPANRFQFPRPNGASRNISDFIDKSHKAQKSDYLTPDNRYHKYISQKVEEGKTDSIYNLRRYYVRENRGKCPTLTANMGGGGHNVPFVKDRWGIRRLTVGECATLQGFKEYEFPDDVSTLDKYRQIGNAVSVPVAAKLGDECVRVITALKQEKAT